MLQHLWTKCIYDAHVFEGITSYAGMLKAIVAFGQTPEADMPPSVRGEIDQDRADAQAMGRNYDGHFNVTVGAAFEVFTEFFLSHYGTKANPLLGILDVMHTSDEKFQVGYDFTATNLKKQPSRIQVKYRGDPTHKLSRSDLASFISISDEEGIPPERRILFTNLEHRPNSNSNGLFHTTYAGGLKQMRVLDRTMQEDFILRSPDFWSDFQAAIAEGSKAPAIQEAPEPWEHQKRMIRACEGVKKGRVICSTGGGKTLVEYEVLRDGFFKNGNAIQVLVAPRIDLLIQHHDTFKGYGMFHRDGVVAIHFRTGPEVRDKHMDCEQTTDDLELFQFLTKYVGRKILIFVTYASEQNLFGGMADFMETADLTVWDEFHHTVRQKQDYAEHLRTIPSAINLFFSASEKVGRVMSSNDSSLYGPKLIEVPYRELRSSGKVVPELGVKFVRIDPKGKVTAMDADFRKAAEASNFDPKACTREAAAIIVAHNDLKASLGRANIVTFSKSVPMCKCIVGSPSMVDHVGGALLQTVHAGVPGRERKGIYDKVRVSDDSILAQHSIMVEGIDFPAFNAAVLSREMEPINTQQAIGRIVRAHPQDTLDFQAGKLRLDDPTGWRKYAAIVYVVVHDKDMEDFAEYVQDLVYKLQGFGLTPNDYQMEDIADERHGARPENRQWVTPLDIKAIIGDQSLDSFVKATYIEQQAEEEKQFRISFCSASDLVDQLATTWPSIIQSEESAELMGRMQKAMATDPRRKMATLAPLNSLGHRMASMIPQDDWVKEIGVLSDVCVLVATVLELRHRQSDAEVTFIGHTEDVCAFATDLGVKTILVPYDDLGEFLKISKGKSK